MTNNASIGSTVLTNNTGKLSTTISLSAGIRDQILEFLTIYNIDD